MITYEITLHRKFWFPKKLKRVKGHAFLQKINMNGAPEAIPDGTMLVIFEDESRIIFNVGNYRVLSFSDEWFKQEAQRIKETSQGQAEITPK